MNSKLHNNSSGFMLMEVMLTIAIVGLTLAPVFMTQNNALRGVYRYAQQLRLLIPARNFLLDIFVKETQADEKEKEREPITLTNPPAQLTYKKRKVSDASTLKKIKDLQLNEVIVQGSRGQREAIVGFTYKPEQKKKEK